MSSTTNIIENGALYKMNYGFANGTSKVVNVHPFEENAGDTQSVKSIKKPSSSVSKILPGYLDLSRIYYFCRTN